MKVKRVALVHSSGSIAYFVEEYPYSARDIDILNTLYEVGKNCWFGNNLYKIVRDRNGCVAYLKYEIYKVRRA